MSTVGVISSQNQQRREIQKSNREQRLANETAQAREEISDRISRRQAAKRARIVRASIAQSSANSGVSGSSGELGATGAVTSSMAGQIGQQKSNILAVQGISTHQQNSANFMANADAAAMRGQLWGRVFNLSAPVAINNLPTGT